MTSWSSDDNSGSPRPGRGVRHDPEGATVPETTPYRAADLPSGSDVRGLRRPAHCRARRAPAPPRRQDGPPPRRPRPLMAVEAALRGAALPRPARPRTDGLGAGRGRPRTSHGTGSAARAFATPRSPWAPAAQAGVVGSPLARSISALRSSLPPDSPTGPPSFGDILPAAFNRCGQFREATIDGAKTRVAVPDRSRLRSALPQTHSDSPGALFVDLRSREGPLS